MQPPRIDRIRTLAAGCPLSTTHQDFQPNWGEGVSLRVGPDGDATLPLLVHALKDAKKGKCLILPLSVAVEAARRDGLVLHVSEWFLREKETDPWVDPFQTYPIPESDTPQLP